VVFAEEICGAFAVGVDHGLIKVELGQAGAPGCGGSGFGGHENAGDDVGYFVRFGSTHTNGGGAGVPRRIPLVYQAPLASFGMELRFAITPLDSKAVSA
jgi:hypothetical protein